MDISDSDDEPCERSLKRKRGTGREWDKVKEFESSHSALEFIKHEAVWSFRRRYDTEDGQKVQYRCNRVQKCGQQCPAAICVLYHCDRETVTVFRTRHDHDHQDSLPARGLPSHVRQAVQELYEEGVRKPKAISLGLQRRGLPMPNPVQLRNYLQMYKKKTLGPLSMNVAEFEKWCNDRSTVSAEDPDAAFVVRYDSGLNTDGTASIRAFISTPRLLGLATRRSVLHAHATYELNWERFAVFVVGTSDQDRHFHPLGLGLFGGETSDDYEFMFQSVVEGVQQILSGEQYRPTVLIADAADAITNGFEKVFGPQFRRVTCWTNAIRAIDKKLDQLSNREFRQRIRDDICELQLCQSEAIFDAAACLFFDKWIGVGNDQVATFLRYFRSEWITSHKYWFEGYVTDAPSTNDALESTINRIKTDGILRNRLPLPRFLDLCANSVVRNWSMERNPTTSACYKPFADFPTKTTKLWTEGFQWASEAKKVLWKERGNGQVDYFIPAGNNATITPAFVDEYTSAFGQVHWHSFDQYVRMRNRIWCVSITDAEWESSSCNCPAFLKEFICKHTVGVAIRKKYCTVPLIARNVLSGQRRKRGRPTLARAALSIH